MSALPEKEIIILDVIECSSDYKFIILNSNLLTYFHYFTLDDNLENTFIVKHPIQLGADAEIVQYGDSGWRYFVGNAKFEEDDKKTISFLKAGSKIKIVELNLM